MLPCRNPFPVPGCRTWRSRYLSTTLTWAPKRTSCPRRAPSTRRCSPSCRCVRPGHGAVRQYGDPLRACGGSCVTHVRAHEGSSGIPMYTVVLAAALGDVGGSPRWAVRCPAVPQMVPGLGRSAPFAFRRSGVHGRAHGRPPAIEAQARLPQGPLPAPAGLTSCLFAQRRNWIARLLSAQPLRPFRARARTGLQSRLERDVPGAARVRGARAAAGGAALPGGVRGGAGVRPSRVSPQ